MDSLTNSGDEKVFRDKVKEHRGSYYVSYQPADARFSFALVDLFFLEGSIDTAKVKSVMEQELRLWLERYPVPVMVSAFDAKDDLIYVSPDSDKVHLMGYVDQRVGEVFLTWELDDKFPTDQMDAKYLAHIYEGVPFRLQEDVRQDAMRKARANGKGIRLIVFLMLGVPLLIELVSLGITWLGNLLAGISISVGFYKLGKAMGWWKPTKREQEKVENELKMRHYFYHCEQNPVAFNRLKIENFEREAIKRTHKEAEALRDLDK